MRRTIEASLGVDSFEKLTRAARHRSAEAIILSEAGHILAATYWLGYSVEALLGAAFYRNQGYRRHDPIRDDQRKLDMRFANAQGWMSKEAHDILGWARFLVEEKRLGPKPYSKPFADDIVNNAKEVYDRWRPKLLYRAYLEGFSEEDLEQVRDAADWFFRNFERL